MTGPANYRRGSDRPAAEAERRVSRHAIHRRGAPTTPGPGTALHAALKRFGITATPGCRCHRHIREMNERGIDWCLANVETIVGWLEEEARRRRLPFVRGVAKRFVRVALGRHARDVSAAVRSTGH